MKVKIHTVPHHRQYYYLHTDNKVLKVQMKDIWTYGDTGFISQDNGRIQFKPDAEELEIVSFKEISYVQRDQHARSSGEDGATPDEAMQQVDGTGEPSVGNGV